jgi:hypothetical protein
MARRAAWGKAPPTIIGGYGFWTGFGQVIIVGKLTNSPLIFGLVLGPDLLHRLDPLPHQLEAGFEGRAVILNFLRIPAPAHAKQKPPARHLVDRGNQLCGLDGVRLHNQAHTSGELQPLVTAAAALSTTNGSMTS